MPSKELHVGLTSFTVQKLRPRAEQIFEGYNIAKCMSQLPSHNALNQRPAPRGRTTASDLPIFQKLGEAYKTWHIGLPNISKMSRHTLGAKIDTLFIETTELILLAGYAPKEQKSSLLKRTSGKLDVLKFFLQLAWEMKILENSRYEAISAPLDEAGRMLGGWRKQAANKTPIQ